MATTTETQTHTTLPRLVNGELPLAVPPISPERCLKAAAARDNNKDSWKDEEGNLNGVTISDQNGIVNPYTNLDHLRLLEQGGSLFSFSCRHRLSPYEAEMVDSIINLSAFENETEENYVPFFDIHSSQYQDVQDEETEKENQQKHQKDQVKSQPKLTLNENSLFGFDLLDMSPVEPPPPEEVEPEELPYTFLLSRNAYVMAGIDTETLLGPDGPMLMSSFKYQKACQPKGTKVWTDYEKMEPNSFRITKPILPYHVCDFTVQFLVSALRDQDVLKRLGRHVGTRVDGGMLLERTKRSKPPREDATKKCKSVLLYTNLGQGVLLVTHLTVMLQKGLPEVVEKLINYSTNKFKKWGLGETCEVAWKTRRYLRQVITGANNDDDEGDDDEEEEEDKFLDAQSSFDDAN